MNVVNTANLESVLTDSLIAPYLATSTAAEREVRRRSHAGLHLPLKPKRCAAFGARTDPRPGGRPPQVFRREKPAAAVGLQERSRKRDREAEPAAARERCRRRAARRALEREPGVVARARHAALERSTEELCQWMRTMPGGLQRAHRRCITKISSNGPPGHNDLLSLADSDLRKACLVFLLFAPLALPMSMAFTGDSPGQCADLMLHAAQSWELAISTHGSQVDKAGEEKKASGTSFNCLQTIG
nr:uncharacterized protein LOC111751333 [Loxodonta africana]